MMEGHTIELREGFVVVVVEVKVEMMVETDVENFELLVRCVMRLVLWCSTERGEFLVTDERDVGGSEYVHCRCASLWDNELCGFFSLFGT